MDMITVRTLSEADKGGWARLWAGYQAFYKTVISPEASETAWRRFADPAEPMAAYGAFVSDRLVGIVHVIYHRSCWTQGDYCYLQDLFTDEPARGQGVGRALIEHVYREAAQHGASRVYWLTHESNAAAMQLYDRIAERSGFIQYRKGLAAPALS